jgi:hypothetical protein
VASLGDGAVVILKIPRRLFWTTYAGIATLGTAGCALGAVLGTSMLVFRKFFEPLVPWVFLVVSGILARRSHATISYQAGDYPWVVGTVYLFSVGWLGIAAYAAYQKPRTDRRIDNYLMRNRNLDQSYVVHRDE